MGKKAVNLDTPAKQPAVKPRAKRKSGDGEEAAAPAKRVKTEPIALVSPVSADPPAPPLESPPGGDDVEVFDEQD